MLDFSHSQIKKAVVEIHGFFNVSFYVSCNLNTDYANNNFGHGEIASTTAV